MAGDSLQAFFAGLGALADPANQLARTNGFGGAGATTDATAAVAKIIKRYVDLSAYGEKLQQLLAAKVEVPCKVWTAYATARQDYLDKSQAVFSQLAAKAITIEQVVYANGTPQPDPADASKVTTLQIQAPLRPPSFVGLDTQCPGLPLMAGFGGAMRGWQPVPISLGSIDSATVAALGPATASVAVVLMSVGTPLGLADYSGTKIFKPVAVMQEDFAAPVHILAVYAGCMAALVKRGRTTLAAGQRCATAAGKRSLWHWLGIGAGVFILGSIVLRFVRGPRALPPMPAPTAGYDGGVALGELYFQPRRRRRGR